MVKSNASKRSRKSNRSNASQCAEEIVQCPHIHFKSDVIDRNVLSKEQHLNILSTPKGYRWEEASDKKEDGQGEGIDSLPTHLPRRVVCSGRRMKKPEKVYVHNFLAEVWTFLTPEMIDRLKGMLMNEFGMSPQEANKFLNVQDKMAQSTHHKNQKTLMKENFCFEDTPMVIKNYVQKQFADIMSLELEETITSLICGPRSKSMVDISERLLEQLVELTGEKCTLQTPKNRTQEIMVFMADRVGVWLNEVVNESDAILLDKREKQLLGIEEGGKGDAGDDQDSVDDDVEIIKKKKRPSRLSRPSQSGDGDNGDKKATGGKPESSASQPPKSKQRGDETDKDQAIAKGRNSGKQSSVSKTEGKSQGEKKGEGKKSNEGDASKKSATNQSKTGGTRDVSKQGSKGAGDSKTVSKPQQGAKGQQDSGKSQQGSAKSQGASGHTSGRPSKSAIKRAAVNSNSMVKGPSSTGSPSKPSTSKDLSTDNVKKDFSTSKGQSQDNVKPNVDSDKRKPSSTSQLSSQRPRTASELKREKTTEILKTYLSQTIQDGEKKSTPRQEALQDVISKRLEEKVGPRDSATIDAIREASTLVATFIDRMTTNVEQEYGETTPAENRPPVAQRGKGPVFSVRKQPSNYAVRQIPHTETKAKVYRARGRPTPGAVALTDGAFKPNETKEWANWANEVAIMADRWSKWIDSTVVDAIKAADKNNLAAGTTVSSSDWKDAAGAEALEWRRNKKLLDAQAKLFSDKTESSVRPKSAPPVNTKNQTKKKIP